MKPLHFYISFVPSKLFSGIATAIALYLPYGFLQRYGAIEILEHLLIAYGIQGIKLTMWQHCPCFLFQPLLHHIEYAHIYTLIQFISVTV